MASLTLNDSFEEKKTPYVQDSSLNRSPSDQKISCWTDGKVKRVWLGVLAAITLIGTTVFTVFAFTATLWFLAPAIPLFLATGAIIWYASSLIDYQNPKELATVRSFAANMPLDAVVKKHGWENLFKYALLSPKQFETSYSAHVQALSVNQMIAYFEEVSLELKSAIQKSAPGSIGSIGSILAFQVTEPKIWKQKLQDEVHGLNFRLLTENYRLGDLLHYGLLTPAELEDSYTAHAARLPLPKLMETYEKTIHLLDSMPHLKGAIPAPERWKQKFHEETERATCREILAKYPLKIEKLLKDKIISEEEFRIFEGGQRATTLFSTQEKTCRVEFDHRTEKERKIRDLLKQLAQSAFDTNPVHTTLTNLSGQCHREIRVAEERAINEQESVERALNKVVLGRDQNNYDIQEAMRNRQWIYSKCQLIQKNLREQIREIETHYKQKKAPYEQLLIASDQLRAQSYTMADRQFDAAVQPIRDQIDQISARFKLDLEERFAEINAQYAQFRLANR
ncbi:MAG: hypothetical protein V4487_00795 [Chlamydiota bacterium]